MMGKKNGQLSFNLGNMTDIIPENHLLRRINAEINFNFIYSLAKPYYSEVGRPSIDPVCLIKMMLVGYLYDIKSERRLEEEITLNIAYRWLCGFNMMDKIPNHSIFSQNRRRRFQNDGIFLGIFNELIIRCIKDGLVTGEKLVCDGSFIPANISEGSIYEMESVVSRSTVAYMDELDEKMSTLPGYRAPKPDNIEKTIIKSTTDEDCGFINQVRKRVWDTLLRRQLIHRMELLPELIVILQTGAKVISCRITSETKCVIPALQSKNLPLMQDMMLALFTGVLRRWVL